jgi:hypothetical protein
MPLNNAGRAKKQRFRKNFKVTKQKSSAFDREQSSFAPNTNEGAHMQKANNENSTYVDLNGNQDKSLRVQPNQIAFFYDSMNFVSEVGLEVAADEEDDHGIDLWTADECQQKFAEQTASAGYKVLGAVQITAPNRTTDIVFTDKQSGLSWSMYLWTYTPADSE